MYFRPGLDVWVIAHKVILDGAEELSDATVLMLPLMFLWIGPRREKEPGLELVDLIVRDNGRRVCARLAPGFHVE